MTLQVKHLSRSYGDRKAVDDVSFEVLPGRLTGFVGGNGAGKTTTMRMILGVLTPDSGEVIMNGKPLTTMERRTFGYMPEERGLYPKMAVQDQLVYFAQLHGLNKSEATESAENLIETLNLTERAKDPVESLSLGNQQRAQIAASLVHNPTALVLDEPFSGLDPLAVEVIITVLSDYAARGVPVLLSSHQLDVVERLCDDVVIIGGGKIKAAGSIDDLREEFGSLRYDLRAGSDVGWLRDHPGVHVLELAGDSARFEVADAQVAQSVLQRALSDGPVYAYSPVSTRLAEIFKETVVDEPSQEVKA